jgi:hypothetical protein
MATTEIDITVKGGEQVNSVVNSIDQGAAATISLKKQLAELKAELATLDPNTAKFRELAIQAGQVKDQINDAAEATNANAGPAFETLGNNASLLTQRLGNLDFEGVAQSAKAMAGSISKLSFKDLINGIKGFGSSLQAIGKALLANPIFLIVAALIAIGAAIKAVLDQQRIDVDKANEAIDKSNEARHLQEKKTLAEAGSDLQKQSQLKEEFARKDMEATEKQIANLIELQRTPYGLSEEQETRLDDLRKKLAQQRVDYEIEAINKLNALNSERVNIQERYENIGLSQREITEKQLEANYKKEVERLIALGATTEELYKTDAFYESELNKLTVEGEKERSAARSAANEKAKVTREKELESIRAANEAERQVANQLLELKITAEKKFLAEKLRLKENALASEKEIDDLELKQKTDRESLRKTLQQTEIEAEIAAVDAKYIELRKLAHGDAELQKQLAEKNSKEVADIEKKYAEATTQTKIDLAQGAVDALLALNDALQNGSEKSAKRAFNVNKALSLAMALTNTYLGATAAFAQTKGGINVKIAAAAVATLAGLANVARIAKTKFNPSGGGGGDTGGGGGSPSFNPPSEGGGGGAPSFNAFNPAFLNDRPNQLTPVQAYVLSGNVANELEASTKIKDKARL